MRRRYGKSRQGIHDRPLAGGSPAVGPCDVLIAGQAVARSLTLITHDVAEFSRVAGLEFEDWLE